MSKATQLSTQPNLAQAAESLQKLSTELNSIFMERESEIKCLMTALVAGEHLLLLGPPGTAKSMLAKTLATALSGSFFELLFSKFTTPEDVYGPISLKGLENDEFRRVLNGRAADTEIFFADEIFKANDAILNAQLTLLNERQYDQDGKRISIPLEICIGASNELPQSDCLAALYDRFVLRRWVSYISDDDNFETLLTMSASPILQSRLSKTELNILRGARESVDIRQIIPAFKTVRAKLASDHSIVVSDRRWRKAVKLVQAVVVMDGRYVAETDDMFILADCLWDKPEDRAIIYTEISDAVSPELREAIQRRDAAFELFSTIDVDALDIGTASTVNKELADIYGKMMGLPDSLMIEELRDEVKEMKDRICRAIFAQLEGSL